MKPDEISKLEEAAKHAKECKQHLPCSPTAILSLLAAHKQLRKDFEEVARWYQASLKHIKEGKHLHDADEMALRLTQESGLQLQNEVDSLEAKLAKAKAALELITSRMETAGLGGQWLIQARAALMEVE